MSEEKMKAFINELFDEYYPECGDIDGGSLQDMAEKHGILVPEIRYEPCGEFCNCNELVYDEEWKEGVKCYRLANWLSAEHNAHLTPESLASSQSVVNASALEQSDSVPPPAQAQVA